MDERLLQLLRDGRGRPLSYAKPQTFGETFQEERQASEFHTLTDIHPHARTYTPIFTYIYMTNRL